MARKTKYTPETIKTLTDAIRLGATHELACGSAGISAATFYEWMNTKPEFFETIKQAEGSGAVSLLAVIQNNARSGQWQAAAWILERRHPEMYGRQRIEHTGKDGKPIEIRAVVELSDDELTRLINETD